MNTSGILRGDIWLVDFGKPLGREQGKMRPSVIVSADDMNNMNIALAFVVPSSSVRRERRATGKVVPNHLEVQPSPGNSLDETSYFMCEQLRAVSIERLVRRIGKLDSKDLSEIEQRITWLLDLSGK